MIKVFQIAGGILLAVTALHVGSIVVNGIMELAAEIHSIAP